jgi:cytoskeletal protein CcmA (bactofilin family)
MSIFRRESTGPATPSMTPSPSGDTSPGGQRRRITHVAPGTRIRGEVTGASELLVEGEIEGEIRLDAAVTVGAEGRVQGPIAAPVVRVSGKVHGNIEASDRVEVAAAGNVEGDIVAPRIVIAEGAFFKGRVEMKGDQNAVSRGADKGAGEPRTAPAEPGKA